MITPVEEQNRSTKHEARNPKQIQIQIQKLKSSKRFCGNGWRRIRPAVPVILSASEESRLADA
jgi:hypothetical protein